MSDECDNCIENEKLIYEIINFLNNSENSIEKYVYKQNLLEGIKELVDKHSPEPKRIAPDICPSDEGGLAQKEPIKFWKFNGELQRVCTCTQVVIDKDGNLIPKECICATT
jgi:hypothetical protein